MWSFVELGLEVERKDDMEGVSVCQLNSSVVEGNGDLICGVSRLDYCFFPC